MNGPLKQSNTDVPWLCFKNHQAWDAVLGLGHKREWARKEVVRRPGDEASSIFFIAQGMLKVTAFSYEGMPRTLWLMGEGSVLGEAAFFSGQPYRHYITVIENAMTYEFSKEAIDLILKDHPELSRALLSNLAAKSYITSSQLEDASFLTVSQRLARFLYGLSIARGSLHLPLSHAEMAELLGIHRVTVSNTLSVFRRAGLIHENTHGITLTGINAISEFMSDLNAPFSDPPLGDFHD